MPRGPSRWSSFPARISLADRARAHFATTCAIAAYFRPLIRFHFRSQFADHAPLAAAFGIRTRTRIASDSCSSLIVSAVAPISLRLTAPMPTAIRKIKSQLVNCVNCCVHCTDLHGHFLLIAVERRGFRIDARTISKLRAIYCNHSDAQNAFCKRHHLATGLVNPTGLS